MVLEPNYTEFSDPRLVALYDTLNSFSNDSEFFCQLVEEISPKTIIDLGCGTGLLTCELAKRGYQMTGIEPSGAMLTVARSKSFAKEVKWTEGSYEKMGGLQVDMVLMTSHVAQFFLDDKDWRAMLRASHEALKIGGHIVFDIRRLSRPPFDGWPTEDNRRKFKNTIAGPVEWWFKTLEIKDERLQYELHYFFVNSGEEVVSTNELVFRSQDEIKRALFENGFIVKVVYGNWDGSLANEKNPEMIFVAERF